MFPIVGMLYLHNELNWVKKICDLFSAKRAVGPISPLNVNRIMKNFDLSPIKIQWGNLS